MQSEAVVGVKNAWRVEVPAHIDWADRLRTGARNKYFIVSTDNHINEPMDVFDAIDPKYKDRVPHVRTDDDGTQWLISEGWAPQPVKVAETRRDLIPEKESFETFDFSTPYSNKMEDEDVIRARSGRSLAQRIEDRRTQGVDAEISFAMRGLLGFATSDVEFSLAMTRTWNRWALQTFASDFKRTLPMAEITPANIPEAIKEVQWAAANGFHGVLLPNRPIFSPVTAPRNTLEYNDKIFEPLWAAIQETGLPITFHVSTGQDPRAVGGNGGAITNYVCHSMQTTIEPMIQLISSGVFERFPGLHAGTIESGAGWVPWALQQMDHAYRAHHMWVRPVIPHLPSDYYKRNCFASFMEEPEAVDFCVAYGLEDNLMWSSDYPHPEGSFPHCGESIQRVLKNVTEKQRAKLLGENAARIFHIDRL